LKNTPLLWAAHKGKLGVIWHLLADGYSPNDVDKMQNNALHLAAAQGDLKILRVLIDDGVVANVVNHYKNHPIDMSKSKEVRDMIAVAMEVGASMTEKDIADKHEKNMRQVRSLLIVSFTCRTHLSLLVCGFHILSPKFSYSTNGLWRI
jgi:ankyrin repeat protein